MGSIVRKASHWRITAPACFLRLLVVAHKVMADHCWTHDKANQSFALLRFSTTHPKVNFRRVSSLPHYYGKKWAKTARKSLIGAC